MDDQGCRRGIDRRGFLACSAALGIGGLALEVLGMIPSDYEERGVTDDLRRRALEGALPRRKLGKTGAELTIIGFGGFHLLEVSPEKAQELLNFYLDAGGNFIETAAGYGDGDSERKIGAVMARRRDECLLSTKTFWRDKARAARQIDQSLHNLQTDHVDNLFMHNVQSAEDLDRILSEDGALRAAEDARRAGKVRFISITSHLPETLLQAVKSYHFDAVMEWINYFDQFNFPLIYSDIISACTEQGTGVICMKPLADGLLYATAERAFRWVWTMPQVTSVATGNNDMFQLASNLALAKSYQPMTEAEKERLYFDAPELASYVCRRCMKCMPNVAGIDIPEVFRLEGYFDRQMMPGPIEAVPDQDLRKGLNNWFGNQAYARAEYAKLEPKVTAATDCSEVEARCPYRLPITAKLKWAAQKLASG
jgi:predicted aldo/keto reductase-like oxidoreductase